MQMLEWFGGDHDGYVTAHDLAELGRLAGWPKNNASRGSIMRKLGFREESPRINGKRARVWVRGNPEFVAGPQFIVGSNGDGRPRVSTMTAQVPPPLPSRALAPPPY